MRTRTPIAMTIAGSDSGGGAGIQADLKTFSALGVYGASVITALTAQNTREVRAVYDVSAEFVRQQLECVLEDLDVLAIKVGMLGQAAVVSAVADALRQVPDIPVVLDPVMIAKSGDELLRPDAVESLISDLLPLASVVTPNLPEAEALLGGAGIMHPDDMTGAARRLLELGPRSVLLKGGHTAGGNAGESTDLWCSPDESLWLPAPRIPTKNTHGTGCTLSAAIAAGLARGSDLRSAVREAKDYLSGAIRAADGLHVGSGHGPVHHFHRWWD